jgi:hypothetical protein
MLMGARRDRTRHGRSLGALAFSFASRSNRPTSSSRRLTRSPEIPVRPLRSSLAFAPLLLLACSPATPASTTPSAPSASVSSVPSASASAPPAASSAVVATPPPPPACIPKDVAVHELAHVEADVKKATICVAKEGNASAGQTAPCLEVTLQTGAVTRAPDWKIPEYKEPAPAPPPIQLSTVGKDLKVCKAGGKDCSTIKTGYKNPKLSPGTSADGKDGIPAAVNADGTKVFALDAELGKGGALGKVYGDTFDVKTGKRLTRVDLTTVKGKSEHVLNDPSDTWLTYWIGERVVVSGHRCCGPDGAEELLDPKKGTSLLLGDPQIFQKLDGDLWLLANEGDEGQVQLVDAAAGKIVSKFTIPGRPLGDGPEQHAMQLLPLVKGSYLLAFANPPGYAVLDVPTKALSKPERLPVCP